MSKPIIEVKGLSKRYKLGVFNAKTLREEAEAFLARFSRGKEGTGGRGRGTGGSGLVTSNSSSATSEPSADFWALRDVSFDVQPGEVIGVIGRNGAGKSTLLKILSRITEPTSGEARIRGRVASLLEVGTGFHPELSGRENIFLNGAILGMTKAEIKAKFDEIVAFAEIEKFIDTPVKRYSSGMYVRLAFAVAAHLEPEILIVDEVLAVGDASFQKKCLGKMKDVSGKDGRTVLFVSHNMTAVEHLCPKSIFLRKGEIAMVGQTARVVDDYLESFDVNHSSPVAERPRPIGVALSGSIVDAWVEKSDGTRTLSAQMGDNITLCFRFNCSRDIKDPAIGFGIEWAGGERVASMNNYFAGLRLDSARHGIARWCIRDISLMPGAYNVTIAIYERNITCVDRVESALHFTVNQADFYGSSHLPEASQGVVAIRGEFFIEEGA